MATKQQVIGSNAFIYAAISIYYFLISPRTNPYILTTIQTVSLPSYDGIKLSFTVSAGSGITSTTTVYAGSKGAPKSVSGATNWSYNEATKIITITRLHSSSATITIDWATVFPSQGQPSLAFAYQAVTIASIAFLIMMALGVLGLVTGSTSTSEFIAIVLAGSGISVALFIIILIINGLSSI